MKKNLFLRFSVMLALILVLGCDERTKSPNRTTGPPVPTAERELQGDASDTASKSAHGTSTEPEDAFTAAPAEKPAAEDQSKTGAKSAARGEKGMEVIPTSASRYAVLVGVNDYEKCDDLRYGKADVTALAKKLVEIGFDRRDIVVLTDGNEIRPTRRNIREQLEATLKVADSEDLVILALSGHGAMIGGKSYFCPSDARPTDPEGTLIRIDELYARLEKCPARLKMVFIDACRDKFLPVESRSLTDQAKSIDGFAKSLSGGELPKGMVLLASCTSGERSWEDKDFGHGVFMHFVMEGLSGKADAVGGDGKKDRWVSLFELCDYVQSQTKRHVLRTRRVAQRPYYHTSLDLPDFRLIPVPESEAPVIADAPPWRAEARIYTEWPFDAREARRRQAETAKAIDRPAEFTNSIGMKFKLIPAGEFMMGSPEDEEDRLDYEGPVHRVRITKPYYLGTYEVTQAEYERIMDENPSRFKGSKRPVERVSWNDAVVFCKRLSEKEGRAYRLPTEAEWEYACRGGTTTPFHFGRILNGKQANCRGDQPYGTETKGPYLGETASVGSYTANAFGLYDMHGDVWEWCSDWQR